ncbi:MAG: M20 family metallopeptidase [Candidatus Omnitrophica bacterium]|nr:M20 family metallopeptidase [Candidatus Omnitrophota bacterium]
MIRRARLIDLTQKVIAYNSENPPGNEAALGKFIERDMRSLGLEVKIHSFAPKRPNIIATLKGQLPRKQAADRAILISPHYDTVPIGQGWKYPPLGGVIHQGKIYGRGASDDKGNLAVCMEVMRSLTEDQVRLRHDLIMAATADEETGSHQGMLPLLNKKILRPGFALVLDSDEFKVIIAQKGLIHLRVIITGKKAHGAYNWLGVNAIEIASRVIVKVKKHKFVYRRHPLLRPPTVNVGVIKGGDKVNMVADHCELALDIRYLPGMDPRHILKELQEIIATETKKFRVEIDDLQYPYEMDPRHPLVREYVQAVKAVSRRPEISGSEGATVISFFQKRGIPAFATGFGATGTAHSTDEYIRIETLVKGAAVLEDYIKRVDVL